jgi:hypothetical protein
VSVQSRIRKIERKKEYTEEKQKYEKIFLEVWDNNLLEKYLLMDMCELLTQEKIKALGNGITLFYYKTTNDRTFVIEDDEVSGTLEIYEEKK